VSTIRSLRYLGPGRVQWQEAPKPRLHGDGEALVEPIAASRCAFARGVVRGDTPFQGPFAIGHEGVARVVEVGDTVRRVKPGDVVVVVWHISCGACERCVRRLPAHCCNTPPGASYGLPGGGHWGGLFDDLIRVPFADAMLTAVPPGVDPIDVVPAGDSLGLAEAIMTRHLQSGRRRVAVLGVAEHGLYQVALAVAHGADCVLYVDDDAERRACAAELGARSVPGPPDLRDGLFDLIVDASANESWLRRATRMLEPDGMIECLGGYFGDIRLAGFQLYGGGINMRFGIGNNGLHVKPAIDAVVSGLVHPSQLYARCVEWHELPDAYAEEPRKLFGVRPAEWSPAARLPEAH
jgi:threonine dehydrogenase-like Zn-dependent dehydrogenase